MVVGKYEFLCLRFICDFLRDDEAHGLEYLMNELFKANENNMVSSQKDSSTTKINHVKVVLSILLSLERVSANRSMHTQDIQDIKSATPSTVLSTHFKCDNSNCDDHNIWETGAGIASLIITSEGGRRYINDGVTRDLNTTSGGDVVTYGERYDWLCVRIYM